MRKTWEHRRPIIKFKVSRLRKRKKEQQPIIRSEYAQSLFDEGAGFNERKED